VERSVSTNDPSYLLLAHSREQPSLCALLAAVHEGRALQAGRPSPFVLGWVLGEVRPWLAAEPDRYAYCPEATRAAAALAPDAV
jgi:hypothetical protein